VTATSAIQASKLLEKRIPKGSFVIKIEMIERVDSAAKKKKARLKANTEPHPDDLRLFREMRRMAKRAAKKWGLGLRTVEHKRRPHSNGALGYCYPGGRISIAIRRRDRGVWSTLRAASNEYLWEVVAHELAHLWHMDHSEQHKGLTADIYEWFKDQGAIERTKNL
jgi:predicted metal-dependent hydrolase